MTGDAVEFRLFKWDLKRDTPEAIDTLQPFHTTRISR
jgi:hypothetical protein